MQRRDVLRGSVGLLGGTTLAATATGDAGSYAPIGRVALAGAKEAVVGPDGRYVYVAVTDGYATVDVADPAAPRVLAERRSPLETHEAGPLRGVQDVKVDGDRLLVVGPAHRRPGSVAGALLVDVSDPATPRELAFHETAYPVHNCALRDGYAYLTRNDGADNPLVVLSVAGDTLREVGRWSLVDHDPAWDEVSPALRPLHDVWVRDGLAALALWDAGTWLVDVADPTAPRALSSVGGASPSALSALDETAQRRASARTPGNHHYATTDERGRLLAVGVEAWAGDDGSGGPGGVHLWDVSDPTAPRTLATVDPPATVDATRGGTWTTAHNLDLRNGILYASWYQGGVTRHELSDPTAPRRVTWWRDPDRTRFWTVQLARRNESFVASSMGVADASAGLYTFPDRPGEAGPSPPFGGTAASTTSATPAPVTPTTSPSPRTSPSRTASTERSTATATADATGPGFGVGVAVAGLLGTAWWWIRRGRS